ncbi:MAG: tellurite resistance TerB family protein [Cyanobacteria bacterium J06600_6]
MDLSDTTSNISTQINVELTPAESFAAIMLAAVAVDGQIAEVELRNVMTTLQRTKMFKSEPAESISQTLDHLVKIIKDNDIDVLIELAIPNLPEYLYETIFAIATDLTITDGAIFNEELNLLSKLSECLSIPEETVDRITQVMMIKNKG